ncbi:MAG: hypothetical protein OJF62_003277 [Pseudolabrys sp.]|nr:hypothetical protein [Pseudolabrys sp.]
MTKIPPPVLFATRDPEPGADIRHAADHRHGLHDLPRSRSQRFTGVVQLIGSVIGIPLALASGYSLYRANFSPESACQSLRAGIVSMLDKNADASTLRMLVHRDVVRFENECGAYDPDAVAAFRNLLAAERAPARHVETRPAIEAVVAKPAAKAEAPAKTEPAKTEPAKREALAKSEAKPAVKSEAVVRHEPKTAAPVTVKREREPAVKEVRRELHLAPKQDGKQDLKALEDAKAILEPKPVAPAKPPAAMPAAPLPADLAPAETEPADAMTSAAKAPEVKADSAKPVETKPAELTPPEAVPAAPQPAQASLDQGDTTQVDAAWVARVREALRESAQRPQPADVDAPPAAAAAPATAPIPPPVVVPDPPASSPSSQTASVPPDHPVPPEPIPNVSPPPAGN